MRWCRRARAGGVAERADVVVVGAGVGGLAVAIRLAAAGRRVVVLERNDVTGGKLATVRHGGATFDAGPSLVTLPHVLEELFRVAGTSLDDELALRRLDPQFAYHWTDGSSLVVPDATDERVAAFDAFSSGAGAAWRRFDDHGRQIWDVSGRTFLAGPMAGPAALLRRMRSPRDLLAIDPLRTLHGLAAASFDDPRLVQWAGRYATYSGSSPYRAPATLACIPHIEARFGCWYPEGGLDALRCLARAAGRACRGRRAHGRGRRADHGRRCHGDRGRRRRPSHRRAGRRGQRRRRAGVRATAARRPGVATGPAGAALDERARGAGARARGDARHRPPLRVVLRRRPRRVRCARGRPHARTTRRSTRASRP